MRLLIAYGAAAVTFLVLDMLWLGVVANAFYKAELGPLMAEHVNIPAAVAFYALYLVGLMIFAVSPALDDGGGVARAALLGALFGFFAYATYDLTNLATLKGFGLKLALVDMAWGTFASAVCAAVAAKAASFA
ncbi:MAG: DUF2177 family protein [Hyphomicrobium sp.]